MNQLHSQPAPDVGLIDLNALKEFAADKRVRKPIFKTGQLVSEMVCYEPGQSTVPHQHPRQDEMFLVLEGCVHMNVGGVEYTLPAGSALSLKSRIMHDVRNLGTERSVIVFIKVDVAFLETGAPPAARTAAPATSKT
jgi:quercetin dioxygenase-like cupin family protein